GRSRFYLSLEDDLMRIFGADRISGLMERLGMEEDVPIEAPMVNRAIAQAQQRVEAMHFDTRKNLFEYDNVMNEQRKAIYALRKQILEGRYQPEILDEQTREEMQAKLAPPPETSGPHTIESLAKTVLPKVTKIVDAHCRSILAAEGIEPAGDEPFPPGGIDAERLTHELYRHYGAMADLDDVRTDRAQIVAKAADVVARSLIQQRERIHDLAFKKVEELVFQVCPGDVHPDEWDLPALEEGVAKYFRVKISIREVEEDVDKLVDRVWKEVEAGLATKEDEFGLYTYLFYVRQFYLAEIDGQWIGHLKNIEHLRTGIGLVGYATRNPKNEYKIRGFNLFKDMWEGIEHTVLDKVLGMRLTAEQQRQAEEGAEYETAVTRANSQDRRRARGSARRQAASNEQLSRLQEAARQAMATLAQTGLKPTGEERAAAAAAITGAAAGEEDKAASGGGRRRRRGPKVGKNDPCPCGSGKLYRRCHGKDAA
ncbi:MAG: SEC-C domain-containing protein, partial [Myxococcales bacterium]|nr:SEC-C domain-containing protein [Myxococcales bacterium]